MKAPNSLQKLADSAPAWIEVIRFNAHGQSLKGYAIVDADGNELLECEPIHYSNGDRWKVINRHQNETRDLPAIYYYKSLAGIHKKQTIKPGINGHNTPEEETEEF